VRRHWPTTLASRIRSLAAAVGAVRHWRRPGFASVDSISSVLMVESFVDLGAVGQTFVVLIGGIDLSVP
jgi:ribose transport system permease protein